MAERPVMLLLLPLLYSGARQCAVCSPLAGRHIAPSRRRNSVEEIGGRSVTDTAAKVKREREVLALHLRFAGSSPPLALKMLPCGRVLATTATATAAERRTRQVIPNSLPTSIKTTNTPRHEINTQPTTEREHSDN